MAIIKLECGPLQGDVLTLRKRDADDILPDLVDTYPNCEVYVGIVRGRPVGYLICNGFQLKHIAVLEEFRRSGIGTALMSESDVSHCLVCELNLGMQLFLKSCGYQCYDTIKNGPTAGHLGYLFESPEHDS